MIYGFARGEYSFADSSACDLWSGRDGEPVSARNYAHEVLSFDEDEYADENIIDELDYHFRGVGWHVSPENPAMAVASSETTVFPFTVRHQVILLRKHYNADGWVETPYHIPLDAEELMEPAVAPKVWHDCD